MLRELQNDRASWFKLELLLYANFDDSDWFVTLTYDDDHLPPTWREAKKNAPRFIRSVREARRAKQLPCGYVYVHEALHGNQRPHHHIVIHAADRDRDLLDRSWQLGSVSTETIGEFGGIQKLAKYITKEPRDKGKPVPGERMWTPSKGLIRPEHISVIVPDDYQISIPADARPLAAGLGIRTEMSDFFGVGFDRLEYLSDSEI